MKLTALLLALALLAPPSARADECADTLGRFSALLRDLRAGDERAVDGLRECAARLCAEFARCDPLDVAEYYAGLSVEARRRGLDEEQRVRDLRGQVFDAGRVGSERQAWALERRRIVAELRACAARVAAQSDFVPAAQAASVLALIEAEEAEDESAHDAGARAELARAAGRDAEEALALFARAGQVTPCLEPEWVLARLALARGEVADARRRFEIGLARAERLRRDDERELALQGLLALARRAGDVRAEERLLAGLARFRSPASSWPLARDWAARLLADDQADAALEFLERFAPQADAHIADALEWELLTGSACLRAGDFAGAREHFERLALQPQPELSTLALASLALRERREFEVLELLDDEPRLASFSGRGRARARALLGEALLATGDLERAVAQLSAALTSALDVELQIALDSRADAFGRDVVERAAGSVIGEHLGLHTVALLAQAEALRGDALEAARVIEDAQSRSLRGAAGALDRGALVRWAARFEAGLVTWVVGADFALVVHVAPDASAVCVRIPRGRVQLEQAARRLREAALAPHARELQARTAADVARELLPDPISARLRASASASGAAPRLLLLTHGPIEATPLELLPWAALAGRDDLALLVLPGLPADAPGAQPDARAFEHWSLLGAPLDADGRELLPGAREELATVLELHPGSRSSFGAEFRREQLFDALRSPAPLHLATHLVAACPSGAARLGSASFVTTDPTPVCADDVAALAPRLPLAVLAACWSGGGDYVDAEGLLGMARAFLESGTRNVLVTQWPVEDGAAAWFGVAFHRALLAGESPGRAAASVRAAMAAAGFAPADWAAFRLLGRD